MDKRCRAPAGGWTHRFPGMKVKDLINRNLIVARSGDTLEDIEERLAEHCVHALPIIDEEGKACGIVTSSDIRPEISLQTPVVEFMADQVYEIDLDAEAREAAEKMLDLGVHHLVVTEGGTATGMISSFDLLRVITVGD